MSINLSGKQVSFCSSHGSSGSHGGGHGGSHGTVHGSPHISPSHSTHTKTNTYHTPVRSYPENELIKTLLEKFDNKLNNKKIPTNKQKDIAKA